MGFKTPDGKEFATRAEWRDYMMATFYSFKNKKSEPNPLVKKAGEVDGQVFDMADCEDCTLIVMDKCEQVQIDKLVRCRVFVGACASSIFIRDCTDCTFYTSCRQLRIRDCTSSKFYSYSMSEIHIELSSGLQFGHLNGGYPEQAAHFKEIKLDAKQNLWFDIYDHNDADKTGSNWSLIKEYDEPWFPGEACDICVTTSQGVAGAVAAGQTGDSFSLKDMITDSKKPGASSPAKSPVASSTAPDAAATATGPKPTKLALETALLWASAANRGIDVGAWLMEGSDDGMVPMEQFRGKLYRLSSVITGVEDDEDAKAELEMAMSATAMEAVEALCPGSTANSVNVGTFLLLCNDMMASLLGDEPVEDAEPEEEAQVEEEEIPADIQAYRDAMYGKERPETARSPMSPVGPKESLIPASPYDEEVAFDPEGEDDLNSADLPEPPVKRPTSASGGRYVDRAANASRSRPKTTSKPIYVPKPRPRSAPPPVRSRIPALEPDSAELQAQVEDIVREAVSLKKTDVYHILQVHLGYIEAYTMKSVRGMNVESKPRQWFTVTDLQRAFEGARIRFSEVQVYTLIKILKIFAKEERENEKAQHAVPAGAAISASIVGSEKPLSKQPVVYNRRVNAAWLRRYLVHLRLNKKTKNWQAWLGEQVEKSRQVQTNKPKDFMRALAGRPHCLTEADINRKLDSFEIVPEIDMQFEIKQRVENWVSDVSGRRDFHHKLNIEIRKYSKEQEINFTRLPEDQKKAIRRELADNLIKGKEEELKSSERKGAILTKELFWKFNTACKDSNYSLNLTFGEWLKRYREQASSRLDKFKKDATERRSYMAFKAKERSSMASLSELEHKLLSVADNLATHHSIELRKSLVALRRTTEAVGKAKSALVTKEDFDRHLEKVLAPIKGLPDDIKLLASFNPRKSRDGSEPMVSTHSDFFLASEAEAAKRAVKVEKENTDKRDAHFSEWKTKKIAETQEKHKLKLEAEKMKKEEDDKKRKAAKKAYRLWVKLRAGQKYISTVDGRLRDLPDANKVRHNSRWSKETGMQEYYDTMEQNFC